MGVSEWRVGEDGEVLTPISTLSSPLSPAYFLNIRSAKLLIPGKR
jgi:hypothetical protein